MNDEYVDTGQLKDDSTAETVSVDFDDRTTSWFADADCVGAGIVVANGDTVVYERALGSCGPDGRSTTANTRYGVGSVSKPVTASAVLRLVDNNTISLDDDIAEYLPWWQPPGGPVTLHQLLTHTSGMPADGMDLLTLGSALGVDAENQLETWEEWRQFVREQFDTRREPGTFAYYNSGYAALGDLIERVTDESFGNAIDRLVFEPLGIDATYDVDALMADEAATPCLSGPDGSEPTALPDCPPLAPAGGLIISPRALGQFVGAHATGGLPVAPSLLQKAHRGHADWRTYANGLITGVGYGWETTPFADDTLVSHAGSTGVSAGYAGFLRERGLIVAIGITGRPSASPITLARTLFADALGRDPLSTDPDRALKHAIDGLPGRYVMPNELYEAIVRWTGERLQLTFEGKGPIPTETHELVPRSFDPNAPVFEFVDDDGEIERVKFNVGETGVTLDLGWFRLERVSDLSSKTAQS